MPQTESLCYNARLSDTKNVAQTFQFAKMCHKLKVCATMHAYRIRNGVSERNRND